MPKFFICILIATMFATGVEAAVDYHGHDDGDGKSVLVDFDDDGHPEGGCDHCCHLAHHMLGMVMTDGGCKSSARSSVVSRATVDHVSRATAPPTPPPNF